MLPIRIDADLVVRLGCQQVTLTPTQGLRLAERLIRASTRKMMVEEAVKPLPSRQSSLRQLRSATAAVLFLVLALLPSLAVAQGAMQGVGQFTPGHIVMYAGSGQFLDAGGPTVVGGMPPNSQNPGSRPSGLPIVNSGLGLALYSGYATGAYASAGIGFDGAGNFLIDIEPNQGAVVPGCFIKIAGIRSPCIATVTGIPLVNNNSALSLLSTATYGAVRRMGFAAPGDAPAVDYQASASPCTLHGGLGDGATQIPSADGKCWLANLPRSSIDPAIFGISGPNPTLAFIVSPAGNDYGGANVLCPSNDPCRTVVHAYAECSRFMQSIANGLFNYVSIPAGNWDETVNSNSVVAPLPATQGESHLGCGLQGADNAGSTILDGDGIQAGVVIATGPNSPIWVRNLKLKGHGSTSSALYAQECGMIDVFDGVIFDTVTGGHFITEQTCSDIEIWNGYTVVGGAANHIGQSNGTVHYNGGGITITVTGTPTIGEWIAGQGKGSIVQINGGTIFSGSITGGQFFLEGGAAILSQSVSSQTLPGSPASSGLVADSTVYPEQILVGVSPTISSPTGIGSTGTASLALGDSKSGSIELSPSGSGIAGSGGLTLTLAVQCQAVKNGNPAPQVTAEGFLPGASVDIGSVAGRVITIQWVNRDAANTVTPLVSGSNYFINYNSRC